MYRSITVVTCIIVLIIPLRINVIRKTNPRWADRFSTSFIDSPNIFYPPSQPQASSLDQWHCFHCKDPLERGERCKRCSCKWCGSGLSEGFCFICASNNKNSSIGDPNPNSFNDSQNLSDYPPQPQYQTNSYELCGNDAHYGYDCPPQVPFVYNQDPCFNQNSDNYYPQNSPSFPQQYLSCESCGGPHEKKQHQPEDIQELLHKLLKDLQIISEELAEYINSPSWNCPAFYDDDDEYTFQYKEYLEN
ncbi:hypothetical protein Tco_0954257 [Tanacetum coccineum]|uniref:Uncharacterized protein n=1 Tax=Tanacetum coccineum TaxID=301880 RepID=A0ABQ5E3M9_9ASTR